jgi:aspartate aminotransferase-like enzyme
MVRVAHLSPDLPEVKVVLAGENKSLSDQIDLTEISLFTEYKVKETTVEVRALSDNHVIASETFNPVAGQYFTIALMGYVTPPAGNLNKLVVKVINN